MSEEDSQSQSPSLSLKSRRSSSASAPARAHSGVDGSSAKTPDPASPARPKLRLHPDDVDATGAGDAGASEPPLRTGKPSPAGRPFIPPPLSAAPTVPVAPAASAVPARLTVLPRSVPPPLPLASPVAAPRPPLSSASCVPVASAKRSRRHPFLKGFLFFCALLALLLGAFWMIGRAAHNYFPDGWRSAWQLTARRAVHGESAAVRGGDSHESANSIVRGDVPIGAATTPAREAPAVESGAAASGESEPPRLSSDGSGARVSADFSRFVNDLVIQGVFQGSPARALLNGRTTRAGGVVDEELGIVFVGIDSARHSLIFRDASGAELTRRF